MEKSWKNLLQELCITCKMLQPVYKTERIDNSLDHAPIWKSVCSCQDVPFDSIGNSKKEAELSAAKLSYEYFNTKLEDLIQQQNKKTKIDRIQKAEHLYQINLNMYDKVILVDGENVEIDPNKVNTDMLVLIFVAKNTSKNIVFELQQNYPNYYVFISQNVGRDAADHLLSFYAGKLSIINPDKNYYVLTKDHYGEFLEKFMNNCKYICSLHEIK